MADNNEVLQNITARLDMIYGKLTVIEGLIRDTATDKERAHPLDPTTEKHNNRFLLEAGIESEKTKLSEQQKAEATATVFITAIMEALKSGKYYLKERYKRIVEDEKRKLLGVYDTEKITLISSVAYKIYAEYVGIEYNVKSLGATLGKPLLYSGLMYKKTKADGRTKIGDLEYSVTRIRLSRAEELYSKTKALVSAQSLGQAETKALKPTE